MIYDLSPPLAPHFPVWPGCVPLTRELRSQIAKGDRVTSSALHGTVHLGSHADAPSHYGANARTIEQQSLDLYVGPCQVLRVQAQPNTRIVPSQITVSIRAPRVLVATGTYPDPQRFREDFAGFAPETIGWLATQGVKLVGIDTPSVDLFDSEDLPSHQACLDHDVAILEILQLGDVPEGTYELIALPLHLVGFDASPVRAILRSLHQPEA